MEQLASQQAEETIRIAAGLAIKNSLSAKVRYDLLTCVIGTKD